MERKAACILLLVALALYSCDETPSGQCDMSAVQANYASHSRTLDNYVYKHLATSSPFSPTLFYPDEYSYSEPCINPNNSNEVIYLRKSNSAPACSWELWTFNSCTGSSSMLAGNICSSIDWSSSGWISFVGSDYKVYKMKDNGDSLTVLVSLGGINSNCKWNRDGEILFFQNGGTTHIIDKDGNPIKDISITYPKLWLSNEEILCVIGNKFTAFNVSSEGTTTLNSHSVAAFGSCYYDSVNSYCYVAVQNGIGVDDYYLRYSFAANSVDTIRLLYDSYMYLPGTYIAGADLVVAPLRRIDWLDSAQNYCNVRQDIIFMHADGTSERLIDIP